MLLFELYFGNKTSKTMNKATLNFQGDKCTLFITQKVSFIQALKQSTKKYCQPHNSNFSCLTSPQAYRLAR